jgi:4-hydroxy-4-methyl-2-oxoglutarate aldolase
MIQFKNDDELFSFINERLYVASVCDILDEMGYRNQAMHQRLRPILPEMRKCGFVGRARTFQWEDVSDLTDENDESINIELFDTLKEAEVVVHSTDPDFCSATWDAMLSAVSQLKGLAGCVCDGLVRQGTKLIEIGFPVFHSGICPVNSKKRRRVVENDIPVYCGNVKVFPGDLVYADFDGVVVIPVKVQTEVFRKASEKVESENCSRSELLQGKSLREVYDKYKSL